MIKLIIITIYAKVTEIMLILNDCINVITLISRSFRHISSAKSGNLGISIIQNDLDR